MFVFSNSSCKPPSHTRHQRSLHLGLMPASSELTPIAHEDNQGCEAMYSLHSIQWSFEASAPILFSHRPIDDPTGYSFSDDHLLDKGSSTKLIV